MRIRVLPGYWLPVTVYTCRVRRVRYACVRPTNRFRRSVRVCRLTTTVCGGAARVSGRVFDALM